MAPRHNGREKVTTIIAAAMTSQRAASRVTGIPQRTISDWMNDPKFAQIRSTVQESFVEEGRLLVALGAQELAQALTTEEMKGRDRAYAAGVAIEKGLLLAGKPTSHVAHETLTAGFDDHERALLRDWLERLLATDAGDGAGDPAGAGALLRQP